MSPSALEPCSTTSSNTDGLSWYAVPEPVKGLLAQVTAHWHTPQVADGYLHQALELAGDHPDVLVSAYRYFFYTQNYPQALQMATRAMDWVRRTESLPLDWPTLKPVLSCRRDDPKIRLYINSYAASGLVQARLGELETAHQIASQVSEIEARNEFGGQVVCHILEHPPDEDEDDDDETTADGDNEQ